MDIVKIGNFSFFEIYIHSKEKEHIPHFHLKDLNTNEKIFISLISPQYIGHNGEFDRALYEDEIHNLIEYFKSSNKKLPNVNNFQVACACWNFYNLNSLVKDNLKMPNYQKLI